MTSALVPARGWLADYVRLYTPHSEAPPEGHLAAGLAVLSAAIGWRAHLRFGDSREPCNLFVVLEGASGSARKTTTANNAASLVHYALRESRLAEAPLRVQGMAHASNRGLLELIGSHDAAVVKLWEDHPPPGVLLHWDEFGSVLGRPGETKASDYLGALRAALMAAYGGRHGGIKLANVTIHPGRCALSLLGTMTRVELEQRVSLGLLSDGFMGRFLLLPHPRRSRYLATPPAWTSLDAQLRDSLAARLLNVALSRESVGDAFGRLSDSGRAERERWYHERIPELDARAREGGDVEQVIADVASRLQATAMRVAVAAAVADADDGRLAEVTLEREHVSYGIAMAEHVLAEIADLALSGGAATEDVYGLKVLEYLRRRDGEPGRASRKEVLDNVRSAGLTRERSWRVVEQLYADGSLLMYEVKTRGRSRLEVELAEP